MLLSTALGINLSQPLLDFVDIDLDLDFPLYLDPIVFLDPKDRFAEECQEDIQDFFTAVLRSIISGDLEAGEKLLAALQEPNETHLGVSKGKPRGRGIGQKQALKILKSLAESPASKSGLLHDLTDCALFIDGIGADKISDITTNIIRKHLIEYTQQQFELLHIPIESDLPTGKLWVRGESQWDNSQYDKVPLIDGKKILLVPKRYVRWRGGMQQHAAHYYNHFVTNFIKEDQLETNGHLVSIIKTKKGERRDVFKKDIKRDIPLTKRNLAHFSVENPKVYNKFKAALTSKSPIGIRLLAGLDDKDFNEQAFSREMISVLGKIPPGRPNASTYHNFIAGLITYTFYPHLITPALEQDINQGRKRIDISFSNAAREGFFAEIRRDPFLLAREIIIECKNYSEDLANNEIDQMIGRFDPRRGRFGIIACRAIDDEKLLNERFRDMFRAQQGAAVAFTDTDFISLLNTPELQRPQALETMCRRKFREIMT